MSKDIFISYSSKDVAKAEIICNCLENNNITCWYAPRNINPGQPWAESIVQGINESKIFLLVYSETANSSQQVLRELERAVYKNKPILPFLTSNFIMNESFFYFISTQQWLKAYPLPIESYLQILLDSIKIIVNKNTTDKIYSSNFQDINFHFQTYKENLISETNNNLVLELYDKNYYEDLCITPYFTLTEFTSLKKKIIDLVSILNYSRAAIIGEPGSGKTTALRMLCLELLKQNPLKLCPVYISLAGISSNSIRNSLDIDNYINEEISLYGCPDLQTLKTTSGTEIILLLDGWDELLDENLKSLLKKFIASSNFHFIIATRPEAQRSLPFAERFEMSPLSYDRMHEFIRLRLKSERHTKELLHWLLNTPVMLKLAEIPLNLSIITIVFQEKENIYKINRTQLYERAFDAILNQHHRFHTSEENPFLKKISIFQIELILQKIAYTLTISGEGRFFSMKELKAAISCFTEDKNDEIANFLIGKLGILRDRRSGRMEFFHLWYQEFLTAKYVLENRKELIVELNKKNLAPILTYVIGLINSANLSYEILNKMQIHDIYNFCRAVPEGNFSNNQYYNLILKVLNFAETTIPKIPVRIELSKALTQLGNLAIPALYDIACNENNNDYSRRASVEAISILDSGSINFKTLLLNLLDTNSTGLLWHVIEHIGTLKTAEALPKLEKFLKVKNPVTLGDSLWAIHEITGAYPFLLNDTELSNLLNCLYSTDEHLMGHALRTIGRLKIEKAIFPLEKYLINTENPYRWIVVEAANLIDCPQTNSILYLALQDNDSRVIASALRSFGENTNNVDIEVIQMIKNLMYNNTWVSFIEGPLSNLASSVYNKLIHLKKTKKLPIIYIGRHCKTQWNVEHRLQGSMNLPLCEVGVDQALSYVNYISKLAITKIITSTELRAIQTGKIYSDKLGIPVIEMSGLRELDHGIWEGKTFAELFNDSDCKYKEWLENPLNIPITNSFESITMAQQRIIECMRQIINSNNNECLLLITHKHIRAILMCAIKNLSLNNFNKFVIEDTLPVIISEQEISNILKNEIDKEIGY